MKNKKIRTWFMMSMFALALCLAGCGEKEEAQEELTADYGEDIPEVNDPFSQELTPLSEEEVAVLESGEDPDDEEMASVNEEDMEIYGEDEELFKATPAPHKETKEEEKEAEEEKPKLDEVGFYTSKEEVALYLQIYAHLPGNFIVESEAVRLGYDEAKGNLAEVLEGKNIGGDIYEDPYGVLETSPGRYYTSCDIGEEKTVRSKERIFFSNDELIYYSPDEGKTVERMY